MRQETPPARIAESIPQSASVIIPETAPDPIPQKDVIKEEMDPFKEYNELKSQWLSEIQEVLESYDLENTRSMIFSYSFETSFHNKRLHDLSKRKAGPSEWDREFDRHKEKVREIFGEYFEMVEDHHDSFNQAERGWLLEL